MRVEHFSRSDKLGRKVQNQLGSLHNLSCDVMRPYGTFGCAICDATATRPLPVVLRLIPVCCLGDALAGSLVLRVMRFLSLQPNCASASKMLHELLLGLLR